MTLDAPKNYDLFVSYCRRDNGVTKKGEPPKPARVTELVEHIREEFRREDPSRPELNIFFDVEEMEGGKNWRHQIFEAIRESHLFLAVLSPEYIKSEPCREEVIEYLKHEIRRPINREGLTPVYFVEVQGLDDKNFEYAAHEWFKELRRRNHFELRAWEAFGKEALLTVEVDQRMAALCKKIFAEVELGRVAKSLKGNVPQYNDHFVGRTEELRLVREAVALKRLGVVTAVSGLGGVGKTALAYAYAHAYMNQYPTGRWTLPCEGETDLRLVLTKLAGTSDFQITFTDEENRDLDRKFRRVLAELKKLALETRHQNAKLKSRILLILDNVDKAALLAPAQAGLLPREDWLHVLVTSRLGETDFGKQGPTLVEVGELTLVDAVHLIESFQPARRFLSEADRTAAAELARMLGGFALAVEAAAVYLGEKADEQVTIVGFTERLKAEGLTGLEEAVQDPSVQVLHRDKLLSATLAPTLNALSPRETLILIYASLLPADLVPIHWLRALVGEEFPEVLQEPKPGYPDPWNQVLRRLISLQLLRRSGSELRLLRMHRLVQELIQLRENARLDPCVKALLALGKERAYFMSHHWLEHENRWELEPLAVCAHEWMETAEPEWALVGADIANQTASVFNDLAGYAEAELLFRRALVIREQSFGPDHPRVAMSLDNLALLLRNTSRLEESELLIRRALAIWEQGFGPDHHPDVVLCLNNLALLLQDTNRLEEAEPLYRRALAISQRSFGPDHPHVAMSLDNLAGLLQDTNRLEEAEPLYRRALAISERSLGPDHPNVAMSLNNLAGVLRVTNRLKEAEQLIRRALAICEQSLGPDHPHMAMSLNHLAGVLDKANRLGEAEPLYRRALAIFEQSLGPDHPHVAASLNHLAGILRVTNRLEEAELLYRRALAICEQSLGPDHPHVATNLNDLALLLQDTYRLEEAEPLFRRALIIREQSFGDHLS